MLKRKNAKTIYDIFICLIIFSAISFLVIYPQESIAAAKDGLKICTDIIIPSLFPFFILSSLLIEMHLAEKIGKLLQPFMKRIFNISGCGSIAVILGFIGGYPVGAKTAISLYKSGNCSKSETQHLLTFCNNSGPAFIFGAVGAGVFQNSSIGLLLFAAHIISAALVGIIFRGKKHESTCAAQPTVISDAPFAKSFTVSVKSSFQSVLNICAFVIFFTIFIEMLHITGVMTLLSTVIAPILNIFGMDDSWAKRIISGIFEISTGICSIKDASHEIMSAVPVVSFILGWAGLSVHCQTMAISENCDLKFKNYFFGKFLHGLISAVISYFAVKILPISITAISTFSDNTVSYEIFSSSGFIWMLSILSAAFLFLTAILCIKSLRKNDVFQNKISKHIENRN